MTISQFLDVMQDSRSCLFKKVILMKFVDSEELFNKVMQRTTEITSQKNENMTIAEIAELYGDELINEAISNVNSQIRSLQEDEKIEVIQELFDSLCIGDLIEILDEDNLNGLYDILENNENINRRVPKLLNALENAPESDKGDLKLRFINFIKQDRDEINFRNVLGSSYNLVNIFSEEELKDINEILMERLLSEQELFDYCGVYTIFLQKFSDQEFVKSNISKILDLIDKRVREENLDESEEIISKRISIERARFTKTVNKNIKQVVLDLSGSKISEEARKIFEISQEGYLDTIMNGMVFEPIGIDPNINVGIEIEANLDTDNHYETNSLINEMSIKSSFDNGSWRFTTDATVPRGSEVVSPILKANENGIREIYGVCQTLQDLGYYIDENQENTAGQINIGIDYLDTVGSLINFYEIYGNAEELLYHICNPEGQFIRQSVYVNSRFKPISFALGEMEYDEDISRDKFLRMIYDRQNSVIGLKKSSVSLRNPDSSKLARLEFKISNGTVNPETWIDNIRLFGRIVQVSKELDLLQTMDSLTPEQIAKLELKESLKSDITLEEKLDILMDLLFDDERTKQIYKDRYRLLEERISETGTDKYSPSRSIGAVGFKTVDFQGRAISSLKTTSNQNKQTIEDNENGITAEVYWRN